MRVTHLSLSDFRNYESAEVQLAQGPNLFVGSNGQGKTNLVESLVFLSTGGSHRTPIDTAMIKQDAQAAVIRVRLEHDGRAVLLELQLNRGSANKALVNRSNARPRELVRYLATVLFAPEDLSLVRGEPSVRRRMLDTVLVQRTPRLAGVLADYDRVLKQRNTLLKSARASGVRGSALSTLDVWDERLVSLGSEIIDERSALIDDLREPVRDAYRSVAGDDHHPRLVEDGEAAGHAVDQLQPVQPHRPLIAGIAADGAGNVYVATLKGAIFKIDTKGELTLFAGSVGTVGHVDGQGAAAQFSALGNMTTDAAGNVSPASTGVPASAPIVSSTWYQVVGSSTGLCAAVPANGLGSGTAVGQSACASTAAAGGGPSPAPR